MTMLLFLLLFLLLFRVLLLSESCRLMLNTEYTCTYMPTDYVERRKEMLYVQTDMTCRPTAEPLMACAEGVVLDHPAPLAE